MSIPLKKPQIKRDLLSAAVHGMLAAVEAIPPAGPNIHNVVLQLKDAFSAVAGKETDETANRAWNWAAQTLTYAASEILVQARRKAPLSDRKAEAVQAFIEAATQFDGVQLDQATLRAPSSSPVFEPARNALPDLLLQATTGGQLELETLDERFDRALQNASNRVFCENPEYFRPLEDALFCASGEAARREAEWARHHFWISSQFTDEPVFSPDADETVPLSAVYLRLRCFWNEEFSVDKGDEDRQEIRRTAHVADLHKSLRDWLDKSTKSDPVRIIAGGPGCGKSSFARAFAHELVQDPKKYRVALIRLQHTHLTGQLDQDIARYFNRFDSKTSNKGNPGLPQSPLEWRKEDDTPLLLIFDGLDELAAEAGESERYAREFLLALMRMLQPLNNDSSPVRAIVLGRDIACKEAMRAACLALTKMLHVAPIAPMTRETCLLGYASSNDEDDLFDPNHLMKIDQRATYWQQWARAKGLDPDKIPESVTHESMSALNLEPLLLHLLIISKYCGESWKQAQENRNLVYEDILEKIYDRNKGKNHFAAHNVSREDFFGLMEVLGLAAWRGNGRTGNEEEFRIVRELHLRKEKHYKDMPATSLKSVALNIHTRPGNSDDDGFEFIHKSFGEYLAARGLLSYARRQVDRLVDEEPKPLAEPWVKLIAGAELTTYVVRFLYDEARRTLTQQKAIELKNGLTEILNWVIQHGFPADKAFPGKSWRQLETYQRCAESALLAAASASASVIPLDIDTCNGSVSPTIDVDTKISPDGPIALVNRLIFAPHLVPRFVFRRINFSNANLREANLSRAILEGANLREANLFGANLIDANLIDANLREAILYGANLSRAILEGANLEGANLEGANLSRANLIDANLEGANLVGANLREANLEGANLVGAKCNRLHIESARLYFALLHEATGLTQEQINSARGNRETTLPDGLIRPDHWMNEAE